MSARTFLIIIVCCCPPIVSAGGYKVTHLVEEKVFKGTTLLADMSDRKRPKVVEVDFKGNVLWQYTPPWPASGALLDAARLDNDNILITVRGSGIYEINRERQIVWRHEDSEASHDADRLPNGNTLYNLGWQEKGEDVVREVDSGGALVWAWNGLEDYDREPFANIKREGWMHVNSVTRLENGNTLVSIRNFNTVAEVSPQKRVVRDWTFRGKDKRTGLESRGKIKGVRNHEPEILSNGHMLVALRKPHRFVEFDLETEDVIWSWTHPGGDQELRTNREANRLPNGNTLCSAGNKLLEIVQDGTIVWQMLAPKGGENHRKFHKAIRIGLDGQSYGG